MAAMSTQAEAIAWLHSLVRIDAPRGEAALALSRALFAELGDPQDSMPAVHVVGTAGKGSVAAAVAAGLVTSGERVASHFSPHVYDIRERFTLDGQLPDWSLVVAAVNAVALAAGRLSQPPTFFAATTATAVELGRRAGADRLVTEAGIGGRVDATNVFGRPDVLTVVTAIGLDHTDVLGTTVEAIAAEKASVLVGRREAVLGPQPSSIASAVVRRIAREHDISLVEVESTGDLRLDTTATAGAALKLLGCDVVAAPASLGGRFEEVELFGRHVILDGAHNPMKLAALADALPGRASLVIAAVGTGKDLKGCADAIVRLGDTVIATTFGPGPDEPGPRSHSAAALAGALRQAGVVRCIEAPTADLVAVVQNESEPNDLVVVTGSFLHLADVRRQLSVA